ncbi:MAG: hypothetical protein WCG85_00760 [Polyangia bacterium]
MRRHLTLALAVLVLLAAGVARPARAQTLETPRARQGYWIGVGLIDVASHLNEEGKNRGFYTGSGFTFRVGQLLTERLGLGLLVEYGGIKKGSDQGSVGGLTLEGSATVWRGLSVHTGTGIGFVMVTDQSSLDKSLRGGGGSYFLGGASYDFFPWRKRLTGGWAVTPTVDFRAMPDGNIHAYSFFMGVQVLWWSGLPRQMLFLPEE